MTSTVPGEPSANLPAKPEPALRDWARTAGDAAISAVPIVGGPAVVLIDAVLRPSYEKRLDLWLEQLGLVVQGIEERLGGANLMDLQGNDPFIDAVTRATQIALGTAIEEKLAMLQAALINVAVDEHSHDFLALRFLSLVDELSIEHFELLRYAVEPTALNDSPTAVPAGTPRALLDMSNLQVDSNIRDLLLHDLAVRGLVDTTNLNQTALGSAMLDPFATPLGCELVEFVRAF